MKHTWWPMKHSSSIVTPSQMNVCELNLAAGPHPGVLLDLHERADLGHLADRTAVQVDQIGVDDRHAIAQHHVLRYWHFTTPFTSSYGGVFV